ncbi:MAG: hypothetical protein IJA82_07155 [Clostridia bacterium]|nr:hypothetical protein [Clostridia bacterium]
MDKRLKECQNGVPSGYILPFLWLHGESHERLYEEILAIKNSGIDQFCAESRPYEDFCGESWWEDFGFILKTAKDLDMKVWLLDDKKFPTGYANGYLEREENSHLRKKLIREFQIDVLGPMNCAKVYVGGRIASDETIYSVIAYKHIDSGEGLDYKSAIDLTDKTKNGMTYWDIPEGTWRVCVLVETQFQDKDSRLFYYIDMLSEESCHSMIDAIYQPHYEHFKEYFGNTFLGFFSDEPAFLNVFDTYFNTLGKMYSPYPWKRELPSLIAEGAGIEKEKASLYLPALWEDLGEVTALIRTHYMDVISKEYSKNFGYQLGNWCRDHGVMYIGHVIEDMGAHMRMGYGSGHFFRALDGQDMAGVDIVLMQDIPGIDDSIHRGPLADGGQADPTFFRYTLPKLASSHSHIQPLKKGRAMCEIFGAFGWAEGLPFMKGLADIMLVSGINHFVPHAFSPTSEDQDCPPHFYNGGKNIQYPYLKDLIAYMKRCAHLTQEGTHKADVCVFYNAEGEWTGGKHQSFFEICKILSQDQIDFDIVPYDALENAEVKNKRLYINGKDYGALIVSQSEILPTYLLLAFCRLAKMGLPVIFTDSLPQKSAEGKDFLAFINKFQAVPTIDLTKVLRKMGLFHIEARGENVKSLRFYHTQRENKDLYLFSNEAINKELNAQISLKQEGECLIYEPWDNKTYRYNTNNGALDLRIEKGNMLFVIFGCEIDKSLPYFTKEIDRIPLDLSYDISIKRENEKDYTLYKSSSSLIDISSPDNLPDFSGTIRYKTSFNSVKDYTVIDLGQVGEVAQLYLNGRCLGTRICQPYKFDLSKAIKEGENTLEVIVQSNLGHGRPDWLSSFMQIPPSGILGDVYLCKYEVKSK